MTASADTAFRVADRLRVEAPWEVFAERLRRYEVYLNGAEVEFSRGPLVLEGFGLRVFRPKEGQIGIGFQATTDLTADGIRQAAEYAESTASGSLYPAAAVQPGASKPAPGGEVPIRDEALWKAPEAHLREYVAALAHQFEGRRGVGPSFGSIRATLSEASLANSAGNRLQTTSTLVELEVAVKSWEGPEGPPPGEHWVNETLRRLDPATVPANVERWCQFARDVRGAKGPPTGDLPVVFASGSLVDIVPAAVGGRLSAMARIREMAPEVGTQIGAASVTIRDDGRVPWGPISGAYDDEGAPQRTRTLVKDGCVSELLYDLAGGAAFSTPSTGSGLRSHGFLAINWKRFLSRPIASTSTVVLEPGTDGTQEELVEAAADGILVVQIGFPTPDPVSTAFGGELRMAYRIRAGKVAEAVRGGTIGGLVIGPPGAPSLLSNVAGVGSSGALADALSAPPLLVRPFSVAGV